MKRHVGPRCETKPREGGEIEIMKMDAKEF